MSFTDSLAKEARMSRQGTSNATSEIGYGYGRTLDLSFTEQPCSFCAPMPL